jgi:hypothetical protein
MKKIKGGLGSQDRAQTISDFRTGDSLPNFSSVDIKSLSRSQTYDPKIISEILLSHSINYIQIINAIDSYNKELLQSKLSSIVKPVEFSDSESDQIRLMQKFFNNNIYFVPSDLQNFTTLQHKIKILYDALPKTEPISIKPISIDNYKHKNIDVEFFIDLPDNQLEEINKIDEKFKNTNNGVLWNERTSKVSDSKKKGGESLKYKMFKIDVADQNLITNIECYGALTSDDNTDLENYIDGNADEKANAMINSVPALQTFIDNNNKHISDIKIEIEINNLNVIDYETSKQETRDTSLKLRKHFHCFEYNKDIVTAFEYNFINNQKAIERLIRDQNIYLSSLTVEQKRIIADYTKQESFNVYCTYKSSPYNQNWFSKNLLTNISDSFFPQINKYLLNEGLTQLFETTIGRSYEKWLDQSRFGIYNYSQFYHIFDQAAWEKILDIFMEDLSEIIKYAPPVRENIYCYRGSKTHYIRGGAPIAIAKRITGDMQKKTFVSNRLSSYTFDFNIAESFMYTDDGSTRSMQPGAVLYRTVIRPFTRILIVAPLSVYPTEFEFISAPQSISYYSLFDETVLPDVSDDMIGIPVMKAYNNHNKPYGILSNYSFNLVDTTLISTPQPIEIKEIAKLLKTIEEGVNEIKEDSREEEGLIRNLLMCAEISNPMLRGNDKKKDELKKILRMTIDGKPLYKRLGDYSQIFENVDKYLTDPAGFRAIRGGRKNSKRLK